MKTVVKIISVAFLLGGCGQVDEKRAGSEKEPIPAQASIASTPKAMAAPSDGNDKKDGEKIFKGTCFLCHEDGTAGAPIVGNKEDWALRSSKGKEVLYRNAIAGFSGNKGKMPPRGGNYSLHDDEVKAAVDYMISRSM